MLKITINGQQADLEGIKFTLQLNSPIPFSPEDTAIDGSFAFGAIFPASINNKRIFGRPQRLEMHPETDIDFTGYLYFEGRKLFDIIVSLTDASEFSFRTNIKIGIGYYSTLIGEKSLRDLAYEGAISLGTTTQDVIDHAVDKVSKTYPEALYNFPVIYNERFYGEENKYNLTWQKFVNFYVHGTGFQENPIDNDNEVSNYYNLCPMPYLYYILKKCFTEFGYNVAGPVLQDTELASLLIYNNYALDQIQDRYKCLADVSTDQFIEEETIVAFDHEITNIDSCYDEQNYEYEVAKSGNHHITAHLDLEGIIATPGNSVQWFVDVYLEGVVISSHNGELMDPLTVAVDINFDQDLELTDVGKHIYLKIRFQDNFNNADSTGYVKAESWFSVQNIPWSQLNTYSKQIDIKNHVPDIKISAFLVALFKTFGIIYSFNQKTRTVELLFLKDILASVEEDVYTELSVKSSKLAGFRENRSYKLNFAWSSADEYTKDNFKTFDSGKLLGYYNTMEDLPELAIEGQFAIVCNLNAVYQWQTNAWAYFTDRFQPLGVGDGKTAVTLDLSPLMMYADYSNPASPQVCPKILQEGSSAQLGMKDFGFHLMFYRGLQEDNLGHAYPFASCTVYGPTGDVSGDYELLISENQRPAKVPVNYGLYENFLKAYYNFVINRGRPVEYNRYFSAADIQNIDFIRKKRVFQNVFFLDQVSIPISNTAIETANMKMVKA